MEKRQQLTEIIEQMQIAAEAARDEEVKDEIILKPEAVEEVRRLNQRYNELAKKFYGLEHIEKHPGDLDNCRQYFVLAVGMCKQEYEDFMRKGKKELARIKSL